jgi:hypothetical protein
MPVAIETQTNGQSLPDLKSQVEGQHSSSRYWQKRYIPGQDETFEVCLEYCEQYAC